MNKVKSKKYFGAIIYILFAIFVLYFQLMAIPFGPAHFLEDSHPLWAYFIVFIQLSLVIYTLRFFISNGIKNWKR